MSNNGGPSKPPRNRKGGGGGISVSDGLVDFARAEVANYARTTAVFVRDAWVCVDEALSLSSASAASGSAAARRERAGGSKGKQRKGDREGDSAHTDNTDKHNLDGDEQEENVEEDLEDIVSAAVQRIESLDKYHDSTLLSHVSRRSSRAQGVAMLTLYTKGLSAPILDTQEGLDNDNGDDGGGTPRRARCARKIVDAYKKDIRRANTNTTAATPGHMAVCWGVMCAALGLRLDRAIHLHLFLHARSLLSSAVRLNIVGPYASSQLLLHPFRQIIEDEVERFTHHAPYRKRSDVEGAPVLQRTELAETTGSVSEPDAWAWADEDELERGPATTWPLGEILMARHDLQHSRIFNS